MSARFIGFFCSLGSLIDSDSSLPPANRNACLCALMSVLLSLVKPERRDARTALARFEALTTVDCRIIDITYCFFCAI